MFKITLENNRLEIKHKFFFVLINFLISVSLIYFFAIKIKINFETAQYFWVVFQNLILCVVLRGFFIQLGILIKNKPYLVIDKSGIQSETHGLIDAHDIVHLNYTEENSSRRLIYVTLVNPEKYLARYSGIKKRLFEIVYSKSGTPVIIKLRGSFDSVEMRMFVDNFFTCS